MRLRSSDIRTRVNADLSFRYQREGLSSFAGIELLRRYFKAIRLTVLLRSRLDGIFGRRAYSASAMVLLLLGLIVSGGRRIRHLGYLQGDPIMRRLSGLAQLPTPRTVNRWLADFDRPRLERLRSVNDQVVSDMIHASGLRAMTVDVDGTVVSTGLQVGGAQRGFNPHNRKRPSYYPITAYAAELGAVLRVENRPGNVHDGKASLGFLERLLEQMAAAGKSPQNLRFRMDGAFFRQDIVDLLSSEGAGFAIKVPFWRWLGLQQCVAERQRWSPISDDIGCFRVDLQVRPWSTRLEVFVFRHRVHHETRKNFQLDLFDPNDGHWEYSAIATNLTLSGAALWQFMCGRGTHEQVYGELKSGFAFASLPSQQQHANSAWQVLSVLAFNLTRAFQAATIATPRPSGGKRATLFCYRSIKTLRFQLFNRAGLLTRPHGRAVLDVGPASAVRDIFQSIDDKLGNAA